MTTCNNIIKSQLQTTFSEERRQSGRKGLSEVCAECKYRSGPELAVWSVVGPNAAASLASSPHSTSSHPEPWMPPPTFHPTSPCPPRGYRPCWCHYPRSRFSLRDLRGPFWFSPEHPFPVLRPTQVKTTSKGHADADHAAGWRERGGRTKIVN